MRWWAAWLSFLAGLWSIVDPFAAGYNTVNSVATTEAVVIGVLIAGFGLWLAVAIDAPLFVDYLIGLFGIWSIIAPFVMTFGHLTAAVYSDVIVGIIALVAAVFSIYTRAHAGAGTLRPNA
jgi:hypothetical protein